MVNGKCEKLFMAYRVPLPHVHVHAVYVFCYVRKYNFIYLQTDMLGNIITWSDQ